jgi:hypothetical protein
MVFKLDDSPEANLDDLGDTLVTEIPEPQQHAIDQAIADTAADPEANPHAFETVELDALGVPYNSEYHAIGADGKGIRTAKGTWRKRRRLKGSASHLNTDAAGPTSTKESEAEVNARTHEHQCRMAGAMAGTMLVRISSAVGGQEFLPRDIVVPGGLKYNEEQFLQTAFGDYFVAKGIVDIPPGMVLCSALAMYYMPRFQQPEVRARGTRFVQWIKGRFEWVYFKFKYRGKNPPAKTKSAVERDGVYDSPLREANAA